MKLFRNYNFTWWQAGLLKIYVLSFGLLIGANFPEIFQPATNILIIIFVALLIYFVYAMVGRKI